MSDPTYGGYYGPAKEDSVYYDPQQPHYQSRFHEHLDEAYVNDAASFSRLPRVFSWTGVLFSVLLFAASLANIAIQSVGKSDIEKVRQIPSRGKTYFTAIIIASAVVAVLSFLSGSYILYRSIKAHVRTPFLTLFPSLSFLFASRFHHAVPC